MSLEIRKEIISQLSNKKNKNIAIAMHNSPDGDCIGSAVALEKMLLKLGKKVDIIIQNKIPLGYAKIVGSDRVNKIIHPQEDFIYDILILLDCSDPNRTIEHIHKISKFIITIDHHYGAVPFGDIYLYERTASTGMIIYKLINMMSGFDNEIANALYLTIRSDTGSFKNNNTDIKAHEMAGDLLFRGADLQLINEIYDHKSLSFLRLMGYTLANVRFDKQFKIVYLGVQIDQIRKAQSNFEEASFLIDQIRGAEDAEIAFLFLEGNDGIRIRARSKSVNVSEIMSRFDGGGHPTASGALVYDDSMYNVMESVLRYSREYLNLKKSEMT